MTPDQERRLRDEFVAEVETARTLLRLAPLLRRLDQIAADEPDPSFLDALGARLASRRAKRRRGAFAVGGLVAAFAAASLVIVVLSSNASHPPTRQGPPLVAAPRLPHPTVGDLTREFPMPPGTGGGGSGGGNSPLASPLDPPQNLPYPGRLRLSARPLPRGPTTVPAYLLRGASFDAPRLVALARALKVRASPTRLSDGVAAWMVVAENVARPTRPLHSVAVSLTTGELIYRDTEREAGSLPIPVGGQDAALMAARAWLRGLGWPADRMQLASIGISMDIPAHPFAVAFGWAGVGTTATAAARLWVLPGGRVVEVHLWPPVARTYRVAARPIHEAQGILQRGQAPLAVVTASPAGSLGGGGSGVIERIDVSHVLVARAGSSFLVPVYRFSGTARLREKSAAGSFSVAVTWYTLLDAARR